MPIYITEEEQLKEMVFQTEMYLAQEGARLAVDSETYGPNKKKVPRPFKDKNGVWQGHIRLLQIGFDPTKPDYIYRDQQYVIDVMKLGYTVCAKYLKPLLETAKVVGHNIKYDWQFLFVHMGIELSTMFDTMLASQVLRAGDKMSHSLADLYDRDLPFGFIQAQTGRTIQEYEVFKETMQESDWEAELTDDHIQYAADDVRYIFYLVDSLLKKIKTWYFRYDAPVHFDRSIYGTFTLEGSIIAPVARMELRGMKLDAQRHSNEVIPLLDQKMLEAAQQCGFTRKVLKKRSNGGRGKNRLEWDEWIEEPLNMKSPKQLVPIVEELVRPYFGHDYELPSTEEKTFVDLLAKRSKDLPPEVIEKLNLILQYKKASHLQGSFGRKLVDLCSYGNYLHPSFFQMGTDTGRFSSKDINCQQIPARDTLFATKDFEGYKAQDLFRKSFISEEGYSLICADYSQEEPRIAAEFCGVKSLIERYNSGKKVDIHGLIAKALMNLPEAPKKGTFERDYIGKTAGLSLLYKIHWKTLKSFMYTNTNGLVEWTDEEAQTAQANFFKEFPEIKQKMDEYDENVLHLPKKHNESLAKFKNREPFYISRTLGGRHRGFYLRPEQLNLDDAFFKKGVIYYDSKKKISYRLYDQRISSAQREAFNHVIQGTAADILKKALLYIDKEFQNQGFDWTEGPIAVIHDEVLVHVKDEHIEIGVQIVKECMERAGRCYLKKVPLEVDIHVAKNWSDAKEGTPQVQQVA